MLSVKNVNKRYTSGGREVVALSDVSIELADEDFLCLLGPTGCGKSTLLGILAGFEREDSGTVMIDGQPIPGAGPDRGVVFQEHGLFPWLTVLANVTFGPRMRGRDKQQTRRRAMEILELVGLGDAADRYPHQLSGGMRQRASIARVLLNEPRLLLMDEPFGALDALTRASMQRLLLDLRQTMRSTVVFVTHDVDEAILLGGQIAVMSAGPGRIHHLEQVPFEHPRHYNQVVLDPRFAELKGRLLQYLQPADTAV